MPPLPLVLAEITGPQVIAIVAIIGGISLAAVISIFGLKYTQRREELWHETARVALERGQPLPPMPGKTRPEKDSKDDDFRAGLILVAAGAGLYLFLLYLVGPWLAYVGAIPGFIGVALLLYGVLRVIFGGKSNPSAGRSADEPGTDRPTRS